MTSKVRMMIAFDGLFDAWLSTILHASVEMCGEKKTRKTALSPALGDESGKSPRICRFERRKAQKRSFGRLF